MAYWKNAFCLVIIIHCSTAALKIATSELGNICGYDWIAVSGARSLRVIYRNCGATERRDLWLTEPRVVGYPHADPFGLYTLIMYDPSVPEQFQPGYLHWLISNIPGRSIIEADLSQGNLLSSYVAPGPPPGTGKHNYSFLLYKQQQPQNISVPDEKPNFNMTSWIQDQSPPLLGPVATNCVKIAAEFWDNSPPVIDRVKCNNPWIFG